MYFVIIIIKTKERSILQEQKTNKYNFVFLSINIIIIIIQSLDELKLIAKDRGIKDYENKSEDDLMKILSEP